MRNFRWVPWFLGLYVFFLLWRFPYESLVASSLDNFARSTNSQVTYIPRSASLFGVYLEKLVIESASGLKIEFGSAHLRLGLGTLSAYLTQAGGQAQINLGRDGLLDIHLENIQMESGSKEMGTCKVTAEHLKYDVFRKKGEGDLSITIPKFAAPIPLPPDTPLEIGNTLAFEDKGSGFEIRSEVKMTAGNDYESHGNVKVEPQGGGLPGRLSGTLEFSAPSFNSQSKKRGTLRLEGTWKKPQFVVVYSK